MKCRNPNLDYMDCWIPAHWESAKNPDCNFCKLKDAKSSDVNGE